MSTVRFPREAAAELLSHMATTGTWGSFPDQEKLDPAMAAENRSNSMLVRPLPSREHLEVILDVVYVASVMEEEGRRVDFTLAYLSEQGARKLNHRVFPFLTPLPFIPSRLAKYALAAPSGTTSLAAWPGKNGQLEVWGLTHHGDHTFAIDLKFLSTYLSVRLLRAGAFSVHFDEQPVMLFSRDSYHILERDLSKRIDLQQILRDQGALKPHIATALQSVCQRMVALGHGGTILLTATGVSPEAITMHETLTMREGGLTLLSDIVEANWRRVTGQQQEEKKREGTLVHEQYQLEERHREALDYVARLTAVDGAVVIDHELIINGFGATISTEGPVPTGTMSDPRHLDEVHSLDLNKRGNRHRSAAYFCARQKGLALAFVASQDGDFTLFARKSDGGVHMIGPYVMGFGI